MIKIVEIQMKYCFVWTKKIIDFEKMLLKLQGLKTKVSLYTGGRKNKSLVKYPSLIKDVLSNTG